jgi:hypothetical protein
VGTNGAQLTALVCGGLGGGKMQVSVVTSIAGAFGGGAKSLSIAIRRQLVSRGFAITGVVIGAYRVQAVVALRKASNGQQPVHIEWTVTDPVGKNLGNVEQFNEVPEGLLDGAWGTLAQQAAQGIAMLMRRHISLTKPAPFSLAARGSLYRQRLRTKNLRPGVPPPGPKR